MQIKEYNRATIVKGAKDKKPFISMQSSKGLVTISKGAALLIGLKANDMIQIVQDEDTDEFFLERVDRDGFRLRAYTSHHALCFTCAEVVRSIIRSRNGSEGYQRLPIGEAVELEGRTLWTIVTAAIK